MQHHGVIWGRPLTLALPEYFLLPHLIHISDFILTVLNGSRRSNHSLTNYGRYFVFCLIKPV